MAIVRVGDSYTGTITWTEQRTDSNGNTYTVQMSETVSGTNDNGSPNVFINGKAVVRKSDVQTSGDDSYEATSYSNKLFINKQPVVRKGDSGRNWDYHGSGVGTFTTGSGNVFH